MQVTIGDRTVTLEAPDPLEVMDVVDLYGRNPNRAALAALGLSWRSVARPKVTPAQCRWDMGVYAGKVLSELEGKGAPRAEIMVAAHQAMMLVIDAYIPEEEVAGVEGNSDAGETSASTSSKSSVNGDSAPVASAA